MDCNEKLMLYFLLFLMFRKKTLKPRGLLAKAKYMKFAIEFREYWQMKADVYNNMRIKELKESINSIEQIPVHFNNYSLPPQFKGYISGGEYGRR